MKVYCSLPFKRIKIEPDGSYSSCCHQGGYYGNLLEDNISLEQAFKSQNVVEVKNSVLGSKLHVSCNNDKCPMFFTQLEKTKDVSLMRYPDEIELALPSTWCNIGGLNPTPDTACIMCPRSSMSYMSTQPKEDNTDRLLEIIKPAIPSLKALSVLGIAEPFWKGKLFDVLDKLDWKSHKENKWFWTYCNGTIFGDKYQDMFLNEYVHLASIGFSIDAATPETYKKIRRLDFLPTIQRNLEKYFKKVHDLPKGTNNSFTAYNINLINLHEMEDMLRFGNNIGVDKVQFTLTYISDEGMALPTNLMCNKDNWPLFWEQQQRVEQLAKELNQKVEFYYPFHKGYLK
jgi:wyosine [tRNA(Phe)-imidazoG37] synthetase (radical SAM superfamily)